ncbi:PEP-CTERM sorting domain-containing protein [Calothrix sp. CCY 0018]|uniref:PEP-CTERM sorting domain-containing protein n=1 Tax=Calothrix sp. CCY 0018 TaxID=3103864 RepID=UPI0039C6EAB7
MISKLTTLLKSVALIPVVTVIFSGSAQAALFGGTVKGGLFRPEETAMSIDTPIIEPAMSISFLSEEVTTIDTPIIEPAMSISFPNGETTIETPIIEPVTRVISDEVEFGETTDFTVNTLDVKDTSFEIVSAILPGDFSLSTVIQPAIWRLSEFDFDIAGVPGRITGVNQVSGDLDGINNISFTDNSISVELSNINRFGDQNYKFNVATEPVPETVPEPMTIFGTGAALGFGVLLKKKKGAKSA